MAYEQAMEGLKKSYKDDYSQIISLSGLPNIIQDTAELRIPLASSEPSVEKGDSNVSDDFLSVQWEDENPSNVKKISPERGFEDAEKKALKAIENHSMIIKGKERNARMAQAYLLMGKARYMQGKSFAALEALYHIRDELKSYKNIDETRLWIIKAQVQAGNDYTALEDLQKFLQKKSLEKHLLKQALLLQSELFIKDKNYSEAIKLLDHAQRLNESSLKKIRYQYVQAQLYVLQGDMKKALEKFEIIAQESPDFEMAFRAKMARAQYFDPNIQNKTQEISRLEKFLYKDKYYDLHDHIYHAMGKITEKSGEKKEAEHYYQKALEQNNSGVSDAKGNIYKSLGDVFFSDLQYAKAAQYYDKALEIFPKNATREALFRKRENMKPIIENYDIVQKKDSLLNLAAMGPEQRKNFFINYIAELKKEDEEKERLKKKQSFTQSSARDVGYETSFDEKTKGEFYFYNNELRESGKNEFISQWGSRDLSDNWRISSKAVNSIITPKSTVTDKTIETKEKNDRRYDLNYYLEQIPRDSLDIVALKKERDQAELSLGIAYFERLKDLSSASVSLERLLSRESEDSLRSKAYYVLYKIYKEQNSTRAQYYKDQLASKFPDSPYNQYVLAPETFAQESSPLSIKMYMQAYEAYKKEDSRAAERFLKEVVEKFPKDKILPKAGLLKAMVAGKIYGKESYIKELKALVAFYPKTIEGEKAGEILNTLEKVSGR